MDLTQLGNRIRTQREKLGLKQVDIANALQISPQAVSRWERAENAPDISTLCRLAKLLSVSTDWLLGMNEDEKDIFDASVFVSSVNGAYKKSLGMNPTHFASWANSLFYSLTETVLHHDAVPIKYMGDQFLCFFSGLNHHERAIHAALEAKQMVNVQLVVGISSGEISLTSVGHPDYARLDIMGETVNLAFLTKNWAEENTSTLIAVTEKKTQGINEAFKIGAEHTVDFKDISQPILLKEIITR